jgi:FkbM family methyltransferase
MTLAHRFISHLPRPWVERCASFLRRSPLLHSSYQRLAASLKDHDGVVVAGPSKGLRFNAGQSDSRFLLGTFEPALQKILSSHLQPGMAFYDVGANVGFLSMLAARIVGERGSVHCFEPLPQNVQLIRHNASLNEFQKIVVVHAMALAQTDSKASFRVSELPTFGALSDSPMAVDREVGVIEVSVRRLDSIFEEEHLRPPDFIKVDIEGSEIDFLAGAASVINQHRPLLAIELHGTNQGVASWLAQFSYVADVVGGGSLEDAPWAALVFATPQEQVHTRTLVKNVCEQFAGR